jgi:hypothetical protein
MGPFRWLERCRPRHRRGARRRSGLATSPGHRADALEEVNRGASRNRYQPGKRYARPVGNSFPTVICAPTAPPGLPDLVWQGPHYFQPTMHFLRRRRRPRGGKRPGGENFAASVIANGGPPRPDEAAEGANSGQGSSSVSAGHRRLSAAWRGTACSTASKPPYGPAGFPAQRDDAFEASRPQRRRAPRPPG